MSGAENKSASTSGTAESKPLPPLPPGPYRRDARNRPEFIPIADDTRESSLTPGWYWVGIRDAVGAVKAPRAAIQFGGVCFPKQTFTARADADSPNNVTYDVPRDGDYIQLTKDDLDNIERAKGRKMVRIVSKETGLCHILGKGSLGYRPMPGDVPLEAFLLMREADPNEGRQPDIPSLAEIPSAPVPAADQKRPATGQK